VRQSKMDGIGNAGYIELSNVCGYPKRPLQKAFLEEDFISMCLTQLPGDSTRERTRSSPEGPYGKWRFDDA